MFSASHDYSFVQIIRRFVTTTVLSTYSSDLGDFCALILTYSYLSNNFLALTGILIKLGITDEVSQFSPSSLPPLYRHSVQGKKMINNLPIRRKSTATDSNTQARAAPLCSMKQAIYCALYMFSNGCSLRDVCQTVCHLISRIPCCFHT